MRFGQQLHIMMQLGQFTEYSAAASSPLTACKGSIRVPTSFKDRREVRECVDGVPKPLRIPSKVLPRDEAHLKEFATLFFGVHLPGNTDKVLPGSKGPKFDRNIRRSSRAKEGRLVQEALNRPLS